MRAPLVLIGLCLGAAGVSAQVTLSPPKDPSQGTAARESDRHYGPARPADLDSITLGDGYQRTHVITEGEVSDYERGHYWSLRSGGSAVLLIPGRDFDASELDKATGERRIEVRGVVRKIREKQYVRGVDLDLIEDPALPPLPSPQAMAGAFRISITVFAIRNRTNLEGPVRPAGGGIGRRILDEPSAFSGKTSRIYGQFRGRNLFGDLPVGSARTKDDWVLKDDDTAMWVTGKMPKGDGWKLDLDYKGDSKSWLEVEGKPEVVNGVVYLKASRVMISKAPGREPSTPPQAR